MPSSGTNIKLTLLLLVVIPCRDVHVDTTIVSSISRMHTQVFQITSLNNRYLSQN